jgi:FMN phosphatase YigB (HAD superfamily)
VESPARIAYIGNEVEADVKGALSVKWTSILVKHTEPSSGGLAHYELDNLLQLKSVAWHE